jgi:hypothetical protein
MLRCHQYTCYKRTRIELETCILYGVVGNICEIHVISRCIGIIKIGSQHNKPYTTDYIR